MDSKYTSTYTKPPPPGMNKSEERMWLLQFTFRPYFVDVYAAKKMDDDWTYMGEEELAYGCCGVFSREQRSWPDDYDMLTKENLVRMREFEQAIRAEPQYKRFCFQDRSTPRV